MNKFSVGVSVRFFEQVYEEAKEGKFVSLIELSRAIRTGNIADVEHALNKYNRDQFSTMFSEMSDDITRLLGQCNDMEKISLVVQRYIDLVDSDIFMTTFLRSVAGMPHVNPSKHMIFSCLLSKLDIETECERSTHYISQNLRGENVLTYLMATFGRAYPFECLVINGWRDCAIRLMNALMGCLERSVSRSLMMTVYSRFRELAGFTDLPIPLNDLYDGAYTREAKRFLFSLLIAFPPEQYRSSLYTAGMSSVQEQLLIPGAAMFAFCLAMKSEQNAAARSFMNQSTFDPNLLPMIFECVSKAMEGLQPIAGIVTVGAAAP